MGKTGKRAPLPAGIAVLFSLLLLLPCAFALALPAAAAQDLTVTVDGARYAGTVRLLDGTSCVAFREFAETVGGAAVRWDPALSEATAETPALTLRARIGARLLDANGRALWCAREVYAEDGTLYVPLRQTAEAFGFRCEYDETCRAVRLTREAPAIEPASSVCGADALYWLSRIIEAEAGGESFEGMLAVGTVVLNRAASPAFPDTVYGVIFDTKFGVQFTPTANGTIRCVPSHDASLAAAACLEGYRTDPDKLYFLNEDLAESFWIPTFCRCIAKVGNHTFYGD